MARLYKIAKVFKKELLPVSSIHKIYVEQSGNPIGLPVVHLHGGPGSASKPKYRKFYNPEKYRIILFDQRGCGKSQPTGELQQNTTLDLVEDMEKIRKHLGIKNWMVSGGSWGSTLALAYAEKYPEKVSVLLVRGIFTFREKESEWITEGGASPFFPDEYEKYFNFIPKSERFNLANAYSKRILSKNKKLAAKAALVASTWEDGLMDLFPKKKTEKPTKDEIEKGLISYRIFYHYVTNNGFLKEDQLLKEAKKLKNIPGVIIQGRYDMLCPPITAWGLHKAWPGSTLEFTIAGHHGSDKENAKKLVEYTNKFAKL